jgi:hypothetical protein
MAVAFFAPSRLFYSTLIIDRTIFCAVYYNRGINVNSNLSVEKVRERI